MDNSAYDTRHEEYTRKYDIPNGTSTRFSQNTEPSTIYRQSSTNLPIKKPTKKHSPSHGSGSSGQLHREAATALRDERYSRVEEEGRTNKFSTVEGHVPMEIQGSRTGFGCWHTDLGTQSDFPQMDAGFSTLVRSQHSFTTQNGEGRKPQAHTAQYNENNNQAAGSAGHHSEITVYSNICALSVIGCAIRMGLERGLGTSGLGIESSDYVIFQAFLANMLGSFILGALTGSTLKEIAGMSPLFTGISTGLCGSITTFSKFNQQISLMIVGEAQPSGDRFFTAFLSILLGLSAPISSFVLGHDLSLEIREIINNRDDTDSQGRNNSTTCPSAANALNYILGISFALCWVIFLVISIVYSNNYNVIFICLSLALAPVGAIARFLLSKLNKRPCNFSFMKEIPLGTFVANFAGSILLAFIHVALTWGDMSCPSIAILRSIGTGFCACLTTISTLVSEILGKRKNGKLFYSHFYPFFTILLCQAAACLINGISYAAYLDDPPSSSNDTCS